jgi:predicted neutral ceramidase superfamily lipid hydrolase
MVKKELWMKNMKHYFMMVFVLILFISLWTGCSVSPQSDYDPRIKQMEQKITLLQEIVNLQSEQIDLLSSHKHTIALPQGNQMVQREIVSLTGQLSEYQVIENQINELLKQLNSE